MSHAITVSFERPVVSVHAEVAHGTLAAPATLNPDATAASLRFSECRIDAGAFATRATVHFDGAAFTFFLRDVTATSPIYVPSLGVAVLPDGDTRSYAELASDIHARRLLTLSAAYEAAPEHTLAAACELTRNQTCPTWLGLSRDIRIFRVSPNTLGGNLGVWGQIEPVLHSLPRDLPESKDPIRYSFILGRGAGCAVDITRRLEDGVLPILHSTQRDGEVEYDVTLFASLEFSPLADGRVRGTHPTAALANTIGVSLTPQELREWDETLRESEFRADDVEQVICFVRIVARNTAAVPRYAYFKALTQHQVACHFDAATGQTSTAPGHIIAIHHLNSAPLPQEEVAILLQPGASLTLHLFIPHRPISSARADALARQSFDAHHAAAREYWRAKLSSAASIHLPEPAIHERVAAGLLHLDINTLGRAADGHLLAAVGWYSPIGSESAPMIQFYDSMGWHSVAERCIQFFLDRQREDGFITTFGGYQLETGPVLWTIGEHYRYTRDSAWAARILPAVTRACDYILAWRERNRRDDLRGRGFGLLDGKVADPEDFFHSFMLNGLAYLGLKRIAEMYREIDAAFAGRIAADLAGYLHDIRAAYTHSVANSPVIPLDDGSWVPSFAPWAEYPGPVSLFAEGGNWFSHGIFACRDTLIGALYLGIGEVLDPNEPLATWLLLAHQQLMTHHNAGFSQPYYCRHDFLHLKRGEVKPFLHTYYNQLAALQDRETYSFWEHYYGVSQHKTHKEAWFLMQTRWMLWMEEHDPATLKLLPGVPRAWLAPGCEIRLDHCVSHFGRFSFHLCVHDDHVAIRFSFDHHHSGDAPSIRIRLPLLRTLQTPNPAEAAWDPIKEMLTISPVSSLSLTLLYSSL